MGISLLTLSGVEDAVGEVFSIRPSIGLEERYDSNPRLRSEDENVTDDYVTSVVPKIEISRDNAGFALSGSYQLVSRHYSDRSELDHISHSATINLRSSLTPTTRFTVSDSVALTEDPIEVPETNGIVIRRSKVLYNRASIALSHDINPLFSVSLGYSNVVYEFDDPNLIDSVSNSPSMELRWKQARNRVITMKYSYTYFSFENSERNNVDEHSLHLGLEERLSPTFTVQLSGGASYVQDVNDRFFSTGQARMLKSFNGSSAQLSYSRSATTSFGLTNEININDTVSLRYDLSLDRSFRLWLSGAYAQNKTEPTERLDIKSFDARINGEWILLKWLRVGIGYSHFNQWGDEGQSNRDIKRDQVFMSLAAAPEWRF